MAPGDGPATKTSRRPHSCRGRGRGAAAHHPRYIGAKVDVVDVIPPHYGDRVMPCAEVLVIRPDPNKINPIVLLLWLRSDEGRAALQACVTGQTAHLCPDDVAQIVVPQTVLEADHSRAAELLQESLRLRRDSEVAAGAAREVFAGELPDTVTERAVRAKPRGVCRSCARRSTTCDWSTFCVKSPRRPGLDSTWITRPVDDEP